MKTIRGFLARVEKRASDTENMLSEWEAEEAEEAEDPPEFIPPIIRVAPTNPKIEKLFSPPEKPVDPKKEGEDLTQMIKEALRQAPNPGLRIFQIHEYLEKNGFPVKSEYWQWRGKSKQNRLFFAIYTRLNSLAGKGLATENKRCWRWIVKT